MNLDSQGRGILDTSTVILLPQLRDAETLPAEPVITAITLAELSLGPLVAANNEDRAARQAHIQQAESNFEGISHLEVVAVPLPD